MTEVRYEPMTSKRTRMYLVITGTTLMALLALLLIQAGAASATCTPPGAGDWIVQSEVCSLNAQDITLNGDLLIQNNGNLTLTDSWLRMASTSDGQYGIEVQNGGTFNLLSGSNITAVNTAFQYTFHIQSGSTVAIRDSTVRYNGYGPSPESALGMWVESNSVTIKRSTFRDSYAAVFAKGSSPIIENSSFTNNRFGMLCSNAAAPEVADSDFDLNTEAVYCLRSKPKLINNWITNSAETGVFLLKSNGHLSGNHIQNNRIGVGILSASPTIKNNNISFNKDGIRAYKGNPVIEKNELEMNKDFQAFMSHTGGRIQDNDITGSENWTSPTWFGIRLQGATTTIRDNRITYIQLHGIDILTNSDVDVIGNTMLYNYAASIYVEASKIRIEGNNISHAYVGIDFSSCTGVIKDNTFFDNRDAMYGGFTNTSLVITGNSFLKNYKSGIILTESHPLIEGNTFNDNERGIQTKHSHPRIIGNSFRRNRIAMDISEKSDIYFADNLVMHGNYTVFANQARAELVNNTIKFSANYSVFFSNGSYGKLVDNKISGNDKKGVYFVESEGWLINNTITDSGTGLYASRTTVKLENNKFLNTEVGIFINRTDLDLNGDTIDHATVFAIVASEGTIKIYDMLMNDTKDGLFLSNMKVFIFNSTISNGRKGISIYNSPPAVISRSTVKNNEDEGLYLTYTKAFVVHCEFEDNKYGIRTLDSPIIVTHSNFSLGSTGISISNADLTVEDSRFETNNDSGIDAFEAKITVKRTEIKDSGAGMILENVTATVLNSHILNNTDQGIWVNETSIVVRDTRIIGNVDGIFDLGNSAIEIFNCNISSNEVYGLFTTDRTIISNVTLSRKIIMIDNIFLIRGHLKVEDGGHAIFLNSPIEFFVQVAGDAGATVETGGKMEIRETIMWGHVRSHPAYETLGYYFTAEKGSSLKMVNSTIKHVGWGLSGPDRGMRIETHYTDFQDTLFHNNSVGLYIYRTSFNGTGIRFDNNKDGLWAEESTVKLLNSSFKDNRENDIGLSFSTADLLNTKISYTKLNIGDEGSILTVKWFLHVSVTWNDGQPIEGAIVIIRDTADNMLSYTTDDQGYIRWIIVREYQQKGPSQQGYYSFSPITINATEKGLSVETTEFIASTTTVNIIMNDDSPPAVSITSPGDWSMHYASDILVIGTASDIASDITTIEVSVDGITWLPALGTKDWAINLTISEGSHTIMAKATDARGNVFTTSITVEIDLSSPLLEVYSPSDGLVTNSSTVMVKGRVHVGSGLIFNNKTIPVTANGTFEFLLDLREGANTLHLKAIKGFGDMEVRLTVFKDSMRPKITLVHPEPGIIVNRSIITVTVLSDEDVTFFINGEEVDTFGGQADLMMELMEGSNIIDVRAIDRAGNTNETNFEILLDVTRPDLLLEKPANPVFTTSKKKIEIIGMTEPGANLTINGEPVPISPDGNFSLKAKLRLGTNTITLVSRDHAGNRNILTLEIKRNEVIDDSNYYWLIALAVIVGLVADVGTFVFFTRYYKKGEGGDTGGDEDDGQDAIVEEEGRREPRRSVTEDTETGDDQEFDETEFEDLPLEEF